MPRLSDTMEDGVIASWLKQVGDQVTRGEVLAEIETDKALMELEAYDDGVLEQILAEAGAPGPRGGARGHGGGRGAPPPTPGGPAGAGRAGPPPPPGARASRWGPGAPASARICSSTPSS